jgi:hypothetical protein
VKTVTACLPNCTSTRTGRQKLQQLTAVFKKIFSLYKKEEENLKMSQDKVVMEMSIREE